MDGLDIGFSVKGFYGWVKPKKFVKKTPDNVKDLEELKGVFDSRTFKGFQAGISIRKRFDIVK